MVNDSCCTLQCIAFRPALCEDCCLTRRAFIWLTASMCLKQVCRGGLIVVVASAGLQSTTKLLTQETQFVAFEIIGSMKRWPDQRSTPWKKVLARSRYGRTVRVTRRNTLFVTAATLFCSNTLGSGHTTRRFRSKHGFDFQAWAAQGVPFLSRAEEATITDRMEVRWAREATAAAEREAQAAATATSDPAAKEEREPAKVAVHATRDGTTFESLEETERNMILDARTKVGRVFCVAVTIHVLHAQRHGVYCSSYV